MINRNIDIKKSHGFTIVELLVVIVVIGILAAITIISYTGILQRANTTKALSNAQSAQNVAEIYFSDKTAYPVTTGDFSREDISAQLPSGVIIALGQGGTLAGGWTGVEPLNLLPDSDKTMTVTWACSGGTASDSNCVGATGGKITYWDFTGTPAVSTNILYVGMAKSTSTFFTPSS